MITDCKVLAWNCRGANSGQFTRSMQDLLRIQCPHIIGILETRISGQAADVDCHRLRKRDWVLSETRGLSGGLWVLWDWGETSLKLVHVEQIFIHFLIIARWYEVVNDGCI